MFAICGQATPIETTFTNSTCYVQIYKLIFKTFLPVLWFLNENSHPSTQSGELVCQCSVNQFHTGCDHASDNMQPANKTVMYIVINNLHHLSLSEVYIKLEPLPSPERIKPRTSTTALCNLVTEGHWTTKNYQRKEVSWNIVAPTNHLSSGVDPWAWA